MPDAKHRNSHDDAESRLLIEAMQEARRGVKLLARVVEAAGSVSHDAPALDRIAREMQEIAFLTWLLAVEARAEGSRLARLSGREVPAPSRGDGD